MNTFLKKINFIKNPALLVSAFVFIMLPIYVSYGQALPPAVSRPPVTPTASSPTPARTVSPTSNTPTKYTLLEPLPCIQSPAIPATTDANGNVRPAQPAITCTDPQLKEADFKTYVQYMFNLIIALAAVSAVFMIVWGGFQLMSSDSFQGKTDGRKKLENAIYGLLLVLCSYLILRTIDPRLVEIPSTLVKPLDIKYTPDEISSFFQQLNDDANRYRKENMAILNNLAAARQEYTRLGTEKDALCEKLVVSYRTNFVYDPNGMDNVESINALNCSQLLGDPTLLDPASKLLAAQIANLDNKQKELTTQMATNTAIGNMNAVIQKCYGVSSSNTRYWIFFNAETGGYTQQDCTEGINRAAASSISLLKANGQDAAANEVEFYRNYSNSMSNINTMIKIQMSSSPDVTALVDTLQTAVTTAATVAGAVYGGHVGGIAAFAGAQVFNAVVIGAPVAASNSAAAERTVSLIQKEFDSNMPSIYKNPKIKEQYQAQVSALVTKLGGTLNTTCPQCW